MKKLELQNRREQKIVGVLDQPDGEAVGTCVVMHGYGGTKEQAHIQVFANVFLRNGFAVFNFDATNSFGESDGEYENARLGLHTGDLEDVVFWAQKQDWFRSPLALIGHSMGGYAVVRFAQNYPDNVAYLVPVAPVVSGKLITEAYLRYRPEEFAQWKKDGVRVSKNASFPGVIEKSPWDVVVEWQNHDLLPNANKLTMPTLLITGSEDTICPPDHVGQLFDAMPDGNKEFEVIEGAPHTYRTQEDLNAIDELINDWLKRVL